MVRTIFACCNCEAGFYTQGQLDRHCEDYRHGFAEDAFGCDTCAHFFRDEDACLRHMRQHNHFGHQCQVCRLMYTNKEALTKHEIDVHYYCNDCHRFFESINNIRQHMNSRAHRGKETHCPFCFNHYATATGMTHHLESGSCRHAPSLNRDSIYKFVRSKDLSGIISKSLIGYEGTSHHTYSCTDMAWNGFHWECYLCHKGFNSMQGLNQHSNSPAHQQSLYHCPNRNCGQDFRTLAAIINHLESEKRGAMRFEQVQRNIYGMVNGNRLLGY